MRPKISIKPTNGIKSAKDLKTISNLAKQSAKEKVFDNSLKTVRFYIEACLRSAEFGYDERKFSNLIKQNNGWFLQTDSEGNGYNVYDIHDVIDRIQNFGYTVEFDQTTPEFGGSTYSTLIIKW